MKCINSVYVLALMSSFSEWKYNVMMYGAFEVAF